MPPPALRHAWGHDELNPLTKTYTDWRCQPDCAFALTMIDGLGGGPAVEVVRAALRWHVGGCDRA